jgi:hypothetical protein
MLGTERDGKINRERIDAFVHRFCRLCGSAGTRRSDLCTLSWGHLCATFRCRTSCVDRWPFTTETHLTGARCHGAAAAGTNAAANLVCQQSLEPRRTATGRCRSCARRFAARRGAICRAPTKRRRSCSGTKICAACNNRLIRPRDVLGEQVGDSAAMADAAITCSDDNLYNVGEEAGWR